MDVIPPQRPVGSILCGFMVTAALGWSAQLEGRPAKVRSYAQSQGEEARDDAPQGGEQPPESDPSPQPQQLQDPIGTAGDGDDAEDQSPSTLMRAFPDSPYNLSNNPKRPRSDLFAPFFSLILPGLDQWLELQWESGLAYSGVAAASLAYSSEVERSDHVREQQQRRQRQAESDPEEKSSAIDQRDVAYRKYVLGALLYQGAGGFSAYHAFRSAVRSRQHLGQYEFLSTEETPLDLLKAPFRFSYLKRASTYVPLAIGLGLAGLRLASEAPEGYQRDRLHGSDAFFTSAYSMNAGTHEEAVFRGWLMPFATEYTGSPFWANVGQAVLFAAAHLNTNSTPLPQLLLGYHLGNVVQDDQWRLGEAIFIHVWWDVLAFATAYSYKEVSKSIQALAAVPVFWLPPLELAF